MTKKILMSIDNTSTLDEAKAFAKLLQDNQREWNQPEKRLAEIREFAEKVRSEKTPDQLEAAEKIKKVLANPNKMPQRRLKYDLTKTQLIAIKILQCVDESNLFY